VSHPAYGSPSEIGDCYPFVPCEPFSGVGDNCKWAGAEAEAEGKSACK